MTSYKQPSPLNAPFLRSLTRPPQKSRIRLSQAQKSSADEGQFLSPSLVEECVASGREPGIRTRVWLSMHLFTCEAATLTRVFAKLTGKEGSEPHVELQREVPLTGRQRAK